MRDAEAMQRMRMYRREDSPRCVSGGFRGATQAVCPDGQIAQAIAARWNAVLDALAEYNDPNKDNVRCTGDRMAEILRNALNA